MKSNWCTLVVGLKRALEQELEQVARYGDRVKADSRTLVIFDRREEARTRSWEDRLRVRDGDGGVLGAVHRLLDILSPCRRSFTSIHVTFNPPSFFLPFLRSTAELMPLIIMTGWNFYKKLYDSAIYDSICKPVFVFDGRNILDRQGLFDIGFNLYPIGKISFVQKVEMV